VDDLRIWASVPAIDGVGNVLGQAGPCHVRLGVPFPITGLLRLDAADIAAMEANGTLFDVVLHEMGHILGIGSLWDLSPWAFLQGVGVDPYHNGAQTVAAFNTAGGAGRTVGPKVPVENTGGAGTVNSHWRESVHQHELMTGWISSLSNPLSIITIASLADFGYSVNMGAADAYSVFNPEGTVPAEDDTSFFLKELPPPTPIVVDLHGNVIRRE
jgi:hypothetical protein